MPGTAFTPVDVLRRGVGPEPARLSCAWPWCTGSCRRTRRRGRCADRLVSRSREDAVAVRPGSTWPSSRPSSERYLGQTAYLHARCCSRTCGRAVDGRADHRGRRDRLSAAAAEMLAASTRVSSPSSAGPADDPVPSMEPFRIALDDFQRRTQGADWYEILRHLLRDRRIPHRLLHRPRRRSARRLSDRVGSAAGLRLGRGPVLVADLRAAHRREPAARVAARDVGTSAGRRHHAGRAVGARDRAARCPTDERIEPVFTELIAAHTRRMDALGLTA